MLSPSGILNNWDGSSSSSIGAFLSYYNNLSFQNRNLTDVNYTM